MLWEFKIEEKEDSVKLVIVIGVIVKNESSRSWGKLGWVARIRGKSCGGELGWYRVNRVIFCRVKV